jgi:hypothetical protein
MHPEFHWPEMLTFLALGLDAEAAYLGIFYSRGSAFQGKSTQR